MKLEKVAYKPVGLLGGVVAGAVAAMLFRRLWRVAAGGDAPHATDEREPWPEILVAAAVEGAIFAIVKAAVDRGGRRAFKEVTGRWPG
jgi:Protein of unknown function (DUF4235)